LVTNKACRVNPTWVRVRVNPVSPCLRQRSVVYDIIYFARIVLGLDHHLESWRGGVVHKQGVNESEKCCFDVR